MLKIELFKRRIVWMTNEHFTTFLIQHLFLNLCFENWSFLIRSSISVPTTRMEVDIKLKSITIDFIEAQSSHVVLQVDVEKSTFEVQPSSHKNNKVINMKAKIGKVNVKLPLMVGQINNVFLRTSRNLTQQLGDFSTFGLHSAADIMPESVPAKPTPPVLADKL